MNIAAFILWVLFGIVSHENGILLALMIVEITIWQQIDTVAKGKHFKTNPYCCQIIPLSSTSTEFN